MSLVGCRECGQQVSTEAATCPHCGVGRPSATPPQTPDVEGPGLRWVPPPNWPALPEGFRPHPGWEPDPSWPAPPAGWRFWQRPADQGVGKKALLAVGVATVLASVLIIGGYEAKQRQGVEADGAQVEASIKERFGSLVTNGEIYVTCPQTVPLRKGKIVDCQLEHSNGKSTPVFITGVDNEGHFQMQLGDPSVLISPP